MDTQQWQDYRDSIIRQVTAKLDRLEPVAEAMDAWEGKFEASFTIEGDLGGTLKDLVRVGGIPLFEDDEA